MIFILIAVGIFVLDFVLKEHVNSTRLQGTNREILNGRLILRNCHNQGFALGILKGAGREECLEASALALGGVGWEFFRNLLQGGRAVTKLGLAMILGGGVNNYWERRKRGYVTDYLSLGAENKKVRNTAFNASDFFILGGALLWMLSALLPSKKKKEK